MTETKYGKYFKTYKAKPEDVALGRTGIARVDRDAFQGCNFYWVHWNLPRPAKPSADTHGVGHPPHIHKDAEILILIILTVNTPNVSAVYPNPPCKNLLVLVPPFRRKPESSDSG